MNQDIEKIVTLGAIFSRLFWQWRLVVGFSVCFGFIFTMIGILKPNIYESVVIAIPNDGVEDTAFAVSGGLSGIASLAGISVNSFSDDTKRYIAMLRSKDFLVPFIKKNKIKRHIFREDYDGDKKKWKEPGFLKKIAYRVDEFFVPTDTKIMDLNGEPDDAQAVERFKKEFFNISADRESRMVTLVVRAYSPQLSYEYASDIIRSINEYARNQKLNDAKRMVEFLMKEIEGNSSIEVKQASSALMENEMKTIMLANTRDDFAFKIIESPSIPYEKKSPNRLYFTLMGLFFGVISSFFYMTARMLLE